jgi:acyl-CoA synthetase (AMP-forming)/AMP-acid ligase II
MTFTPIAALRHNAETQPDSVAFISGEDTWTYQRLAQEAGDLARGFAARGVRPGDRVVLHMVNRPEMVVAYYACFLVGAIAVPFRTAFKAAELIPLLERLRPALYIGDADLYARIAAVDRAVLASDRRFVIGAGADDGRAQPWTVLFGDTSGAPVPDTVDGHAPAVLITTSGTTGQPKLVIHTPSTLGAGAESLANWGLDGSHVAVMATAMGHASGLFTMLAYVRFGVPFMLLDRFDPDAVLDVVERHRCTWLLAMPYMFGLLLERQKARPRNVASLRSCITGGDVCPQQLQDQFPAVFGCPLHSIWAATETIGAMAYRPVPGPACRIVKGAQVRLVDDRGLPVRRGEIGELLVRGPDVSIGYWAGPGAVEGAPRHGWYQTGDLMRQDENGDLWFVSRKKELIIRGGTNISPVEIEEALAAHPAVKTAAAVGVADAVLGQRVAGFVQLEPGAPHTTAREILADVTARLADYKVPEWLEIVEEIPRNNLGKIDRRSLLMMIEQLKGAA